MKKLLSFVLAVVCLFSLCGFAAQAESAGVEETGEELWALAEEAYIFCYPLVLMEMTTRTMPENTLVHARTLATADDKSVVTLNVDTLYTQIMLDVSDEPIILTLPETDRFMEMQIMDAWSNTTAVLDKAGVYAFVKKGDTTELPANVTKVDLPTSISWVLGRVILNGNDDLPNVIEIQDGMDLCPLSVYNSGEEHHNAALADEAVNNDIVPVKAVAALGAEEFFGLANKLMADNPPAEADKTETDRIAALGVGAGLDFDPAVLKDESGDGWKAMQQKFYADIMEKVMAFSKKLGNWNYFGEPIGDFGTEYTYRAAVAVSGFGANTTDVAIYPRREDDENDEPFDGTQDYILHFDTLPPVQEKGFWSITVYGNDDFLIANPLDRYCVNDRSDFRLNDDGSLDILLTAKTDTESDLYVLPTASEGFHLVMRIYLPDKEALKDWTAPVITKKDTAASEQPQSEKDETEMWALAEEAYIFSYPLVLMEMTARTLPANTLVHARTLATAEYKNVDTCYTQIMLDIKDEPIILTLPETDRFMEMQVMDAWSNTTTVLDKAGVYAFVKKGDTTELPANVTKVELPTRISWVLGRVIVNGDDDLPNVVEVQDGMDLCPLSVYNSGEEHHNAMLAEEAINKDIVPVKAVAAMGAKEFFGLANELMADNPPAEADKPETDRIAALGVGAGLDFDPAVLKDESGDGWKAMLQKFYTDIAKDAAAYLKNLGIWSYFGEPVGDFGTEYTYRAAVAVSAFGANTTEVAIYPKCAADENGDVFDGSQDYILHFDTLPPVLDKGFWSITAYDNDDFLIANPLNRYCVNDRSDFRLNDDGSLDILLTAKTDTESDLYVLPTDSEGFHLFMRIYLPDTKALETWTAPVITKR